MLLDSVRVVGKSEGQDVVLLGITHLCQWDTVQQICELLRQDAHKSGTELSFHITSVIEDI